MQLLVIIAMFAYFLFALASVMDKHIVSNTGLKPVAYAFYSGFFQILYVIAVPIVALASPSIVFSFPSLEISALGILDGIFFIAGLVALYKATEAGEISRISPIVGVFVPIFTFILAAVFLHETLTGRELFACMFFILGGFLMSAKIDGRSFSYINGMQHAAMAGFLFAAYYVLMDFLFAKAGFAEVFILMQFGGFVGAVLLLIPEKNREMILEKKKKAAAKAKIKKDDKTHGILIFFVDKGLSAAAALLINYAVSIGSATIVNSLQAVQYAFILIFTLILSRKAPHLFDEETHHKVVIQKGAALALTAMGLVLIS